MKPSLFNSILFYLKKVKMSKTSSSYNFLNKQDVQKFMNTLFNEDFHKFFECRCPGEDVYKLLIKMVNRCFGVVKYFSRIGINIDNILQILSFVYGEKNLILTSQKNNHEKLSYKYPGRYYVSKHLFGGFCLEDKKSSNIVKILSSNPRKTYLDNKLKKLNFSSNELFTNNNICELNNDLEDVMNSSCDKSYKTPLMFHEAKYADAKSRFQVSKKLFNEYKRVLKNCETFLERMRILVKLSNYHKLESLLVRTYFENTGFFKDVYKRYYEKYRFEKQNTKLFRTFCISFCLRNLMRVDDFQDISLIFEEDGEFNEDYISEEKSKFDWWSCCETQKVKEISLCSILTFEEKYERLLYSCVSKIPQGKYLVSNMSDDIVTMYLEHHILRKQYESIKKEFTEIVEPKYLELSEISSNAFEDLRNLEEEIKKKLSEKKRAKNKEKRVRKGIDKGNRFNDSRKEFPELVK